MTPKLTYKERAEKLLDDDDQFQLLVDDPALFLEQAFTQVANEALEEAAKFLIDEQMDHAEVYAEAIRSLMERGK